MTDIGTSYTFAVALWRVSTSRVAEAAEETA